MMKILICAAAMLLPWLLPAQLHDKVWKLGYNWNGWTPDINEGMKITFNDLGAEIEEDNNKPLEFWYTNSSFCDSSGQLLFYSNGVDIADGNDKLIAKRALVNDTSNQVNYDAGNYMLNGLFIVEPQKDIYQMVYSIVEDFGFDPRVGQLNYAILERKADNNVQLISKGHEIIRDTLMDGNFVGCKHANGRDWWFIALKAFSDTVFVCLATPDSMFVHHKESFGYVRPKNDNCAQAKFSPDGKHFAVVNNLMGLNLLDFDRCTGHFSNLRRYDDNFNVPGQQCGGVSFSPNGQFMYFSNVFKMYQVDLSESNDTIIPLLLGEYDDFLDSISNSPTAFAVHQLGMDGRIYVSAVPVSRYIHLIQEPDKKGLACGFIQHAIKMTNINSIALGSSPDYRLGPIDGSECDTLGIDNLPLSRFRYTRDTSIIGLVHFTDLSSYEPDTWYWDFGDGGTSSEKYPSHNFKASGIYKVCLTVSNKNGSDTSCKNIDFTLSTTGVNANSMYVKLAPNPANNWMGISISEPTQIPLDIEVIDLLGRRRLNEKLDFLTGMTSIETSKLENGMYFLVLNLKGRKLGVKKFLIQH